MAGKGRRNSSKFDRPELDKFHVIEFSDRERVAFEEWSGGAHTDLPSFLVKLCEFGWKVSFSYSQYYHCYYGSLTDKRQDSAYADHTFSVRHSDLDKLTRLLDYVYSTMLIGDEFRLPDRMGAHDW